MHVLSRIGRPRNRRGAFLALALSIFLFGVYLVICQQAGAGVVLGANAAFTMSNSSSAALPSPTCPPTWYNVPVPTATYITNANLAISARTDNDVWIVGAIRDRARTLTMHWDGASWDQIPSPNPDSDINQLSDVAAVAANDVWAVGTYGRFGGQALIIHWDGISWTQYPNPVPGARNSSLYAVTALSANDVWAAGQYQNKSEPSKALVLHWNGSQWSQVVTPNPGSELSNLRGVSASSANDVWAVGVYRNLGGIHQTLVMRWNGSTWSVVSSPNPSAEANSFRGVETISSNDVWAVGYYGNYNGGNVYSLIMHWNGSQWTQVSSPNPGSRVNDLSDIAAASSNDIWAIGIYHEGELYRILMLHWNGSNWSHVIVPNPDPTYSEGASLSVISANDVWAAGESSQPIVERYTNICGTPTPFPTPTAVPTITLTPTPVPPRCPGERFTDVCPGDYFYEAVVALSNAGVISGYNSAPPCENSLHIPCFKPFNSITRGQAAKIIVLGANRPINTSGGPHFSDVPISHTFYSFIETAYNAGIISGYADGTFRPGNNITRGQFSKIVVIAFSFPINTSGGPHFTDVPLNQTFYQWIETAFNRQLISGYADGTFRPGNDITRGQASKIVYQARLQSLVTPTPSSTLTPEPTFTPSLTFTPEPTSTTTPASIGYSHIR